MEVTARRYRACRRLARLAAMFALGRRKGVVESILRSAFGDTVEAGGHLMDVDPNDRLIGARLRRRGVWSEAETNAYTRWIRPGMTVIDVGANIGYFSLIFARLVGPAGHVLAFEPEPHNFEILNGNIERNGYENVTSVCAALTRREGEARLVLDRENLGDHRLDRSIEGRESIKVRTTTLDRYLGDDPKPVDFIKLDIQGGEPAAFEGARGVIDASPSIRMLTEFWPEGMLEAGEQPRAYLDGIREAGFSIAVLEDSGGLVPVGGETNRARLCADDTDVNLFCWKGESAKISQGAP